MARYARNARRSRERETLSRIIQRAGAHACSVHTEACTLLACWRPCLNAMIISTLSIFPRVRSHRAAALDYMTHTHTHTRRLTVKVICDPAACPSPAPSPPPPGKVPCENRTLSSPRRRGRGTRKLHQTPLPMDRLCPSIVSSNARGDHSPSRSRVDETGGKSAWWPRE